MRKFLMVFGTTLPTANSLLIKNLLVIGKLLRTVQHNQTLSSKLLITMGLDLTAPAVLVDVMLLIVHRPVSQKVILLQSTS